MLRCLFLLVFVPALFLSCSPDRPAPVAPAGKVAVLAGPTNLRCEVLSDTSVKVLWDGVDGATDYDINYRTLSGRWTNEPHKGDRLYNTIYDLEPGTEYRWAVRAENANGPSNWVFAEENFTTWADSDFDIVFIFEDVVPERERLWFRQAADMWEEVIVGDLPDEAIPEWWSYEGGFVHPLPGHLVDDLLIYVDIIDDHPSTAGAQAGVYATRTDGSDLPLIGAIRYESEEFWEHIEGNAEYFDPPVAENIQNVGEHRMRMMALHEIGHALGFGSTYIWSQFIKDKGEKWGGEPGVTGYEAYFSDPQTIEVFNALEGPVFTGNPVPTNWSGVHWSGLILPEDVMGGNGSPKIKRISTVTLEALACLGYQVNRDNAGYIKRWENFQSPLPSEEGYEYLKDRSQYPYTYPYPRAKPQASFHATFWTCTVGDEVQSGVGLVGP